MRSGRLNRKITILAPVTTRSTISGELVQSWTTHLCNRWAYVEPLMGRELFTAKQYKAQLDTRFTIRYVDGITPDMRIVYNGSSYFIHSIIDPEDRHTELQIICSKVSS